MPELASLHVARDLLASLRGSPLGDAIGSVLQKIDATLAPAARKFLSGLGRELSARTVHAKDPVAVQPLLATIQGAIRRRRTLAVEYHSFGRNVMTRRRLDPLHVWLQAGGAYLAAFCHTRREVRTFAVERFRAALETERPFEPPADFDLERYLSGCFGLFRGHPVRVVLRFSSEVARYVAERRWHPTQAAAPLLTGELDLTLTAPLCPELRQWILGHGRHVEVRAPARLRAEIRREWLAALRGPGGRVEAVRPDGGKPARPYRPTPARPALAAAERRPGRGTTPDRRLPARR
jgi:predicted DNA-binding transcriptional regulator YafY